MTGTAHPRADVGLTLALTEGYEVLRDEILEGRAGGLGLALFLREGMAAWVRAWEGQKPVSPTSPSARLGSDLPEGVHGEVVTVLAGMALSTYREALP